MFLIEFYYFRMETSLGVMYVLRVYFLKFLLI